jgi:hypothetical protein
MKIMQESPEKRAGSTSREVLKWIFTILAVVMLARLVLVAFRFTGIAFNWIRDGGLLERLSDLDPWKLALNIIILVAVAILLARSERPKE